MATTSGNRTGTPRGTTSVEVEQLEFESWQPTRDYKLLLAVAGVIERDGGTLPVEYVTALWMAGTAATLGRLTWMTRATTRNRARTRSRQARQPREPRDRRQREHPARSMFARVLLGAATTLVSLNLWTGGPLLALWVGSRVQAAAGQLSMAAVGATLVALIVETFVLYRLLAWLTTRYNEVLGRTMRRRQAPWLKPMSGERRAIEVRQPLTAPERIVIVCVVVAVEAFVVWFFFFAHYALPG